MKLDRYINTIIESDFDGLRLDKFLFKKFENANNVLIQKSLRNKDILVNEKTAKNNQTLNAGDNLLLSKFLLKILNSPPKTISSKKELKFTDKEIEKVKNYIIYKDDYIIAINKPSGLAVQSGTKIEKSLNDFLPFLKFEKAENPKLVHRLDKDTSGALLLARKRESAEILSNYFKEKTEDESSSMIDKIYLTLVVGKPSRNEDLINIPLIKKLENGVEKVYRDEKEGKKALTRYKVIEYFEQYNVSLLEVKILTGRTHQIRVHLKEIGHPIVGDGKYGGKRAFIETLGDKLFLHSYRINIKDFYGRDTNIKADLPENFDKVLSKLKRSNKYRK